MNLNDGLFYLMRGIHFLDMSFDIKHSSLGAEGLIETTSLSLLDKDGGKNPVFQAKFVFTLIEGLREINVVVWNSNTLTYDDFIGSGKVQIQDVLYRGYDDRAWPLQTKTGRYAGEVRLIMHYANANKPATSFTPTAPTYSASTQPQMIMYSAPPPAHTYPTLAYPPPPSAAYPPQPTAYPPPPTLTPYHSSTSTTYPYPPNTGAYSPYPYPPPPDQPPYSQAAYPPPPSAYPPPPYPPPSHAPPCCHSGHYPGAYPPPPSH